MARKSKAKFTMKGHTLPGINQTSDANLKDGKSPSSAFQQKTATVDGTTYENPYTAYQTKNIPKRNKAGVPAEGGEIYSPISGLQVSGPGTSRSNRKRTDEMMRGEGKVYMMEGSGLDKTDADNSGLPDEFEYGMSKEIKDLSTKKKKDQEGPMKIYSKKGDRTKY